MLMQCSTGTRANCFESFLDGQPLLFSTSPLQMCERATQPWTVCTPLQLFFFFFFGFNYCSNISENAFEEQKKMITMWFPSARCRSNRAGVPSSDFSRTLKVTAGEAPKLWRCSRCSRVALCFICWFASFFFFLLLYNSQKYRHHGNQQRDPGWLTMNSKHAACC